MTETVVRQMRPTHPGEILREDVIPALRMSKVLVAKALRVSRQTLHDLLAARQGVTPLLALKLERVVGGSAEMWMNLQRDYDLSIVRRDKATEIAATEKLAA